MDQPAEGPEREEQPRDRRVQLVNERCRRHELGVRAEGEEAPEPDGDGGAVVVAAAERAVCDRLVEPDADDDDQEQDLDRAVIAVACRACDEKVLVRVEPESDLGTAGVR